MTRPSEKIRLLIEGYESNVEKLNKKLQRETQAIFKEVCLEFFAVNHGIKSFGWRQFEPWRDGEETEFEVFRDEESVFVNGARMEDVEDDWDDQYKNWTDEQKDEQLVMAKRVSMFLQKIPIEFFDKMFGDGAEVTITPRGIKVEEYYEG